jgi:biopolymer transport protein ExbB
MLALLRAIIDHGGMTVLFIAFISLGSMTIVIERCWRLLPLRKQFQAVQQRCQALLLRSGSQVALQELPDSDAMSRVLKSGLAMSDRGAETMRAAAMSAAQREVFSLERGLSLIQIAAQIAPWLGLLGTVVGLMDVFASVGDQANVTHAVAATGIYQALACTVAGLAVAIGAYVAYQILAGISSRLIDELEQAATDLPLYAAGAKASP